MVKKEAYCIAVKALSDGDHKFTLTLGESFVTDFAVTDYAKPALKVKIEAQKNERMARLSISLSGTVEVECDRCLEPFAFPVKMADVLLVLFDANEEEVDMDENVINLPEGIEDVDLGHFLFESVQLALPLRKVHPERRGQPTCNAEMLARMNQGTTEEAPQETDPRWSALKKLKF